MSAPGVLLGREVRVKEAPREAWKGHFQRLGFSPAAAEAYARMTAATVDHPEYPSNPIRGAVSLQAYIRDLVVHSAFSASLRKSSGTDRQAPGPAEA